MIVKILGTVDVAIGFILLFGFIKYFPEKMIIFLAMIMIAKSLLGFFKDFASWIDFSSGIFILLLIVFPQIYFMGIIFGILLIQKGIFSFL